MKINQKLVKIRAAAIPIERELINGDEVILRVEGEVVAVKSVPCYDGTEDVTYEIKGTIAEEI